MKKVFLPALALLLSSCTITHPFEGRNIATGNDIFEIKEDYTCAFGLDGVYVYTLKKGRHQYIMVDTGYSVTLIHDEDCTMH